MRPYGAPLGKPGTVWVTAAGFPRAVAADEGDGAARTIGSVLLIVGLAGLVPFTIVSLRGGPGRSLRAR